MCYRAVCPRDGELTVRSVMSMTIHFICGLCLRFFINISLIQTLLKSILVMKRQPASYLRQALHLKDGQTVPNRPNSISCQVNVTACRMYCLHLRGDIAVAAAQHQNMVVRSGAGTAHKWLQLSPLSIPLKRFLLALLKEAIPELDRSELPKVLRNQSFESHARQNAACCCATPI